MTHPAVRFVSCGKLAVLMTADPMAQSNASSTVVLNLSGIYNERRCVPANSDVCPEMNVKGGERWLTARGRAFVVAFDEVAAPKYDCSPATLPIIFGDPYAFRIEQQPDRVTFAGGWTCDPIGPRRV